MIRQFVVGDFFGHRIPDNLLTGAQGYVAEVGDARDMVADSQVFDGLLAGFNAVEEVADVGIAFIGTFGKLRGFKTFLLSLRNDFPAFVVDDQRAFAAAEEDAPGTVVEAVVLADFVFPDQGVAGEFIDGDLGVGSFGIIV